MAPPPPSYAGRPRLQGIALLFACLFLPAFGGQALAHDIPNELRVHMHVQQAGDRLHVLARLPLALLLNLDLPKQGPGYLDLARIEPGLARAVAAADKDIRWFEDGDRLVLQEGRGRISPPSDRSFDSFESARRLLAGPPLPASTYVFWNQGYFDVQLTYPLRSARPGLKLDFAVAPGLRDRLKIDLRYSNGEGSTRAYELHAGSGPVALDPRWHQAAATFVVSGFHHILDGPDHLLFLICLILPYRRVSGYLIAVVTSFTVAHSVTLIAAAYGLTPQGKWFQPLVELLIAASIVFMAIENIFSRNIERRWVWSGLFGLVHGFGFSFLLASQLQFAGSHLLLSLLAFNVGIELGQILVLLLAIPAIVLILKIKVIQERAFILVVSVLVAHTAWHWTVSRAEALWAADWTFEDSFTPLAALSALAAAAALAAIAWSFSTRQRRPGGLPAAER